MADADDMRRLALSLPETFEQPAWGFPTFRVAGGKVFAGLNPDYGPGIAIDREARRELVAAEPKKFYWVPHDERYNFFRVRLEALDVDELGELLTDAWCLKAGPRRRARYGL